MIPPSSSSSSSSSSPPSDFLENIDDSSSATSTFSPPPAEPPSSSSNGNSNNQEVEAPMAHLESILTTLGFQELAVAVPSLSDSAYYTWNGPSTVFAPTDDSIRSCIGSGSVSSSCSVPQILREHIVPGIFSYDYLNKLAFGTKLETMSTGRCITVTTASSSNNNNNNNHDSSSSSNNDTSTIVYIGGVEITHPDFFNNGLIVVHRLEGFISPLSPFSCNIERMNSLSFPPPTQNNRTTSTISSSSQSSNNPQNTSPAIMRLMLKDAMLRLHNNGFSVLCQALKVKYPEIVNLQNMTVFALDDASIFSGGHAYLSNFRFHIVPNKMMLSSELMRLPTGTTLPTLDPGQSLMVTTAGNGGVGQMMRINYVRIKMVDVVYNLKIAVHSIFLPFPHLHPAAVEFGSNRATSFDSPAAIGDLAIFKAKQVGVMDSCAADKGKGCRVAPVPQIVIRICCSRLIVCLGGVVVSSLFQFVVGLLIGLVVVVVVLSVMNKCAVCQYVTDETHTSGIGL
ncbi:hypothetical protein IFM89_032447 [Coptis chinensis]|uniref:FAS1 domain-containing protein n=1 Tax=Coptis chinensis TaxID=261450 RepID=A0A835I7C1_9MAGN|nr:hypothetical protein IFM89_032447 [Coptis chinensis]